MTLNLLWFLRKGIFQAQLPKMTNVFVLEAVLPSPLDPILVLRRNPTHPGAVVQAAPKIGAGRRFSFTSLGVINWELLLLLERINAEEELLKIHADVEEEGSEALGGLFNCTEVKGSSMQELKLIFRRARAGTLVFALELIGHGTCCKHQQIWETAQYPPNKI